MAIMQNRGDRGGNPGVYLAIISIAILFVIIAAGLGLYHRFSAPPPGPPPAVQQTSQQARNLMLEMTLKCHGHFRQLSPADQAIVQQASRGQGIGAISETALEHNIR